eukprot:SAG31_NODE_640_length_13322_cov_4.396703_12_plen_92_part_00
MGARRETHHRDRGHNDYNNSYNRGHNNHGSNHSNNSHYTSPSIDGEFGFEQYFDGGGRAHNERQLDRIRISAEDRRIQDSCGRNGCGGLDS